MCAIIKVKRLTFSSRKDKEHSSDKEVKEQEGPNCLKGDHCSVMPGLLCCVPIMQDLGCDKVFLTLDSQQGDDMYENATNQHCSKTEPEKNYYVSQKLGVNQGSGSSGMVFWA